MKKLAAILLSVVLLLTVPATAWAEPYEKPILFRGLEWGSTHKEAVEKLPDGVVMAQLNSDYWYKTADRLYQQREAAYKGDLGWMDYSLLTNDLKVAGYDVDSMQMVYVYTVDEDGNLIRDEEHTSFVYGCYKLDLKDPDAAYADLLDKLSGLYGDVDKHEVKKSIISYEMNLWEGENGTVVSLVDEVYDSGSHYIWIKYSYYDADELIEAAYEAAVREETNGAKENVDGL